VDILLSDITESEEAGDSGSRTSSLVSRVNYSAPPTKLSYHIEEAKSLETELEVVESMQFNRGYARPTSSPMPKRCALRWKTRIF
jgi:chaperonin GroEL (HSP60 family)